MRDEAGNLRGVPRCCAMQPIPFHHDTCLQVSPDTEQHLKLNETERRTAEEQLRKSLAESRRFCRKCIIG